jgi:hypothetical protein
MAVISIKNKTKSGSLLVGNPPFIPNDYESIATVTVGSGGAANITFSSIPSTYQHLQIRGITRNAAATDTTIVRLNSDTGSNYAKHILRGNGSAASAVGQASTTSMEAPFSAYSGVTSNVYGGMIIDILDYANTNKNKTTRMLGGADLNGSGWVFFTSGLWMNTSAVTTVLIAPESGNFEQYSQFALYGIKG